jgi:hypothetical protein
MRRFLLLTAAILTVTTLHLSANDLVEIRVNGHYFAEPATLRITVTIEPDHANRVLRVEADGDSLFRSTEVTLDGSSEKRVHSVEFRNLPAGGYEIRAEVLSATEVRGAAVQDIQVVGSPR